MNVRDAVEADADGLAAIADRPSDVMRNLVHDRSVRVAVEADGAEDADGGDDDDGDDDRDVAGGDAAGVDDADEDAAGESTADRDAASRDDAADSDADGDEGGGPILGFVSFDARPDAVHVTQLAGTRAAVTRLIEEPLAFARREGMPVELLVPDGSPTVRDAVEAAGFDERGAGPRFEGDPTVRYRFES